MSQQISLLRVSMQLKSLQCRQSMRSAEAKAQSNLWSMSLSWRKYLQSWDEKHIKVDESICHLGTLSIGWRCLFRWLKLTTTKVFAWVAFKWRQRQRWCRDNENTSIDLRCHSAQSHHFVNTYTLWTHIYFGLCCLNERFAWYAWYGTYLNL